MAYDRIDFIHSAIDSALNQSIGSTFFDVYVVSNFPKKLLPQRERVKYIFSEKKGKVDMLMEALDYLTGEIVCFLDDDDLFHIDKVKVVKEVFEQNRNLVYYHNNNSNIMSLPENMGPNKTKNPLRIFNPSLKSDKRMIAKAISRGLDFNSSSISISIAALNKHVLQTSKVSKTVDSLLFALAINNGGLLAYDNRKFTFKRIHQSESNALSGTFTERNKKRLSIHYSYALDYRNISRITNDLYFSELFFCRAKVEETMSLIGQTNQHLSAVKSGFNCTFQCIKFLNTSTLIVRLMIFLKERV